MKIEKGELESDLPSNRNAKIEVSIKNEDSPRSSIPEISPKNLFNDDTDSDDLFSGLESRKLFGKVDKVLLFIASKNQFSFRR